MVTYKDYCYKRLLLTIIFVTFDLLNHQPTPAAMTIEEVTKEPMYCLFAPDGNWQPSTLAADFATCVAFINLLAKSGMGQSFFKLKLKGFKILPVSVTAVVTGDENTAFKNR